MPESPRWPPSEFPSPNGITSMSGGGQPAQRERASPWFAAAVFGGTIVGVGAVFWPFLSPALRKIALPYIPASEVQVANVVRALKLRPRTEGARMVDVGSGDGRLVVAAAKEGYTADGVELNHWLNIYARLKAMRTGVGKSTTFHTMDLWQVDYSQYDDVVVFGVSEMMDELYSSLKSQLKPGSRMIVCRFAVPGIEPDVTLVEENALDTVWIYHV
eukprot:m.461040 g.461040  ORF g.461040 m.461040 type:complete len:216 (-) comp22192_c0_seq1:154-801(-)